MTASATPLVTFAEIIGISRDQLWSVERVDQILYTFSVSGERLRALRPEHGRALIDAYGAGVRVEFKTGALVELTIQPGVEDEQVEAFVHRAGPGPYDVVLDLDKRSLVELLVGAPPGESDVVVYLFPEALSAALAAGLRTFESSVWSNPDRRLLVLVPDLEVKLQGAYLALFGGSFLDEARNPFSDQPPLNAGRRLAMVEARDQHIGWDAPWTENLTPDHFDVLGHAESAELLGLVRAQFVKLAILHTCDRARVRDRAGGLPEIRAEFRGREYATVIVIDESQPLLGVDESCLLSVGRMVDWCYQGVEMAEGRDPLGDRLPFVQTRVAQALESRAEPERLGSFVTAMPYLIEGIEWHWKAFIEGRVSEYLDRVHEFESLVSETTASFSDQTSQLVKNLADSILAAVAVLVGAFIAATFTKPFNATLFRIAVIAYAIYVGLFPGLMGMLSNARQQAQLDANFAARRERFKETLFPAKVDEIVGDRITKAIHSYWIWVAFVGLSYLMVIVAAVVGAIAIPGHIL